MIENTSVFVSFCSFFYIIGKHFYDIKSPPGRMRTRAKTLEYFKGRL